VSEMSAAESLLEGWDDEEQVTEVISPAIVDEQVEGEEIPAAPEPEPQPEVEEDEQEEDEGGEEGEEEDGAEEEDTEVEARSIAGFDLADPEVIAYLAQYQDDPVKALRAAAELRRAYGRQGTELAAQRQRASELEQAMHQSRMLSGSGTMLSAEQHEWAENAATTTTPGAYIEQAINAGEFDLARAVCSYWAREDPFSAQRAGQLVDQVEFNQQQATAMPTEAPTEDIIEALYANVPGMREWEPQMVQVFNALGSNHHLVQEARSNNIDLSMRALINIFEIAKASSASVQERKSEIKKEARAKADGARAKAAVTSATSAASTPSREPPRADQQILPGLTFGDLEEAFQEAS